MARMGSQEKGQQSAQNDSDNSGPADGFDDRHYSYSLCSGPNWFHTPAAAFPQE